MPGVLGQAVKNLKSSNAEVTELCWYCQFMPSTSKFPKFSSCHVTTSAQTQNVNPPQQSIRVWPCNPTSAPATEAYWRLECSTPQGQWRSERSTKLKSYFWDSVMFHAGNHVHEESLANNIWQEVLDGWWSLQTSRWSSWWSVGHNGFSCMYMICVSIAWSSIAPNISANTRSCKAWILFNNPPSDLQYWLCSNYTHSYNWDVLPFKNRCQMVLNGL